jgi:carbamoyl-phosphate synthase large subunit
MDTKRILVTGVGANPGFDLTRSLLRLGHHVIATDASPLAPGLLIPTVTAKVTPRADDPAYRTHITALCQEVKADAVVAGIENDLPPLFAVREEFDRAGVRLWLPDEDSARTCIDKAAFARVLAGHGIATVPTFLPDQLDQVPDQGELVVKPRRGHGAQNVHFCHTREQARVLAELLAEAVIQPRILSGTEIAKALERAGFGHVSTRGSHAK